LADIVFETSTLVMRKIALMDEPEVAARIDKKDKKRKYANRNKRC
jgi:hypothetical protein